MLFQLTGAQQHGAHLFVHPLRTVTDSSITNVGKKRKSWNENTATPAWMMTVVSHYVPEIDSHGENTNFHIILSCYLKAHRKLKRPFPCGEHRTRPFGHEINENAAREKLCWSVFDVS